MKPFIALILSTFPCFCFSQSYPEKYFGNPIDPPFILAGTFGEIRSDHFHSGIDFSTSEIENKPVYAAAKGYVSRIKISSVGFGKAIYITHPNGYVTVYAHLNRFSSKIEKYVRQKQYEKESFEIELFPTITDFLIKKGDLLGYSGNTGSSDGPHLHFEIRDEKTEEPINPELFGYKIPDIIRPDIRLLRVVPMKGMGIVETTDTARTYRLIKLADGTYSIESKDTIKVFGKIGFEFSVQDEQKTKGNSLGIYSMQLKIDSSIVYSYKYQRFNFSDTRYANAHIDYAEKINQGLLFERCFRLPGNHLKIYHYTTGVYDFKDEKEYTIEATIKDFNSNTSKLKFKIHGHPALSNSSYQPLPRDYIPLMPEKGITIQKPSVEIYIPIGALYERCYFMYTETMQHKDFFSPDFIIGNPNVPLHLKMTIGIKLIILPYSLKDRALIISYNKNGNLIAEGGYWNGSFLFTETRHFGAFAIAVDTIPPLIDIKNIPGDRNGGDKFRIFISDELSGIKSYRASLDGKWFLLEYDAKNKVLTGLIEKSKTTENHHFEIRVIDERNNQSHASQDFFY